MQPTSRFQNQPLSPKDELEAAVVAQTLEMLRVLRKAGWHRHCIVQIEIRGRSVMPRVREVTLGAVTLTDRPNVL